MMVKAEIQKLCVALQSRGVRFPARLDGRRGGAGPSEGQVMIVAGYCLTVPTQSWYVSQSPYHVDAVAGKPMLFAGDTALCEVAVPERPAFYDQATGSGTPFEKIALLHGRDCLASTLYQDCIFFDTPQQCRFCGIGLSLAGGKTVLEKSPDAIAAVARAAAQSGSAAHVTLTSGCRGETPDEMQHLTGCIRLIKKTSGLPVHVQICPSRSSVVLQLLREAGADTIGLHIESFCEQTLADVAPAKARLGRALYERCWRDAVSLFGENQVSSFLIAGLGESLETMLAGARRLCELGVFPYVLPLRPVPGTALETSRPPDPAYMMELYEAVAQLLRRHGLASANARAGCVRCGACSALQLFED